MTDRHTARPTTRPGGPSLLSRRDFVRRGAAGAAGAVAAGSVPALLAACHSAGPARPAKLPTSLGSKGMAGLVSAAKKDGHLNTIALPPGRANYAAILAAFHAKYKIVVSNASPDDTAAQANRAITSLKGRLEGPDAVEVTPTAALAGVSSGLYAPYRVATWDTIPAGMKDPGGRWYGDYYGAVSFGTNMNVQQAPPLDWPDLLTARYRGQVAIGGDPTKSRDAFAAVYAAALGNGGSLDDIEPGINFFARLKKAGNFVPVSASPATIVSGATPVTIRWDYLNLSDGASFKGNPRYQVSIPASGVYGGFLVQAISKYAPDPMAARLWEEFLYSDQGQLLYLAGFAHPVRYADLARRGVIPASLAAKLPPASQYKSIAFATPAQIAVAGKVVAAQWGPKVAG